MENLGRGREREKAIDNERSSRFPRWPQSLRAHALRRRLEAI